MKKIFFVPVLALVYAMPSAYAQATQAFNCGRIVNNWPPAAADGKDCCVDNAVWKNVKGIAVIQGTNITHIQYPGK